MPQLHEPRWLWLKSFKQSECGATVVEAALMFGLIILATVVGMGALGQRTNRSFENSHTEIQEAERKIGPE